jgi:hypothetical protein
LTVALNLSLSDNRKICKKNREVMRCISLNRREEWVMRFWIMSVFAVVSFATPVFAQQADLRQQIEQIATAYTGNFNKGDAAGIAGLYTTDGILVTPSAKIVKNGQQEITEHN